MGQGVALVYPGDLLKLMQKQLAEGGTPTGSNLPGAGLADRAFLSLWNDKLYLKNPRAKQFVVIRPNRFPVWQTVIQGAGSPVAGFMGQKTMTGFNSVITTVCFTQINADPEMRSVQAITEETLGVISFVLKVIKALQFWNPFDSDPVSSTYQSTYLREPCRMTDGGFGLNPIEIGNAWWISSPIDWECKMTARFPE